MTGGDAEGDAEGQHDGGLKGGRRANATDSQVLAKSKALASHKALADKQKRLAAAQADAPPQPPGAENAKPRRFF